MSLSVFVPEFHSYEGRINTGHCYCAMVNNISYIITCLHLFGPGGGLLRALTPEELPTTIYKYCIHDPNTDTIIGTGGAPHLLKGTYPLNPHAEELDASGDLAAFPLPKDANILPMILADRILSLNEDVWIVGIDRFNIESVSLKRMRCSILDQTPEYVILKPEQHIATHGLSGAPIVDSSENVIGMVVGGLYDEKKRHRIIANPAKAISSYFL